MVLVGSVSDVSNLISLLRMPSYDLYEIILGSHFKSEVVWNTIIEKVERRLARWKRIYLGGSLTLIKCML